MAYHNNGTPHDDERGYFARLLSSLGNHRKAVPQAAIIVVNHAASVHILELAAADDALGQSLADLRRSEVRFLICANTLAARRLDWRSLPGVNEDDVVPSGVAVLAELQLREYAYIHLQIWNAARRPGLSSDMMHAPPSVGAGLGTGGMANPVVLYKVEPCAT